MISWTYLIAKIAWEIEVVSESKLNIGAKFKLKILRKYLYHYFNKALLFLVIIIKKKNAIWLL